jgi:hypothetical protein
VVEAIEMRILTGIILLLAFVSITKAQTAKNPDKIKITNLYAAEAVTRGVENEITVEVAYTFESADEAEINLGFNTNQPNGFKMVDSRIVRRGSGAVTFKVKVIPVDWGERGRFSAMVNISKHPHDAPWRPSASDRKEIPVGQ